MTSFPVGFIEAGTGVGAVVGAGTLVAGDPLLGTAVGGGLVDVADDPQATATTSIVAVSTKIMNGIWIIRCLAIFSPFLRASGGSAALEFVIGLTSRFQR